jgi:hypothetical protein
MEGVFQNPKEDMSALANDEEDQTIEEEEGPLVIAEEDMVASTKAKRNKKKKSKGKPKAKRGRRPYAKLDAEVLESRIQKLTSRAEKSKRMYDTSTRSLETYQREASLRRAADKEDNADEDE